MTTSNHASAGTRVYGNHANQRAQTSRCGSVRNGNTVTDDPEGLGGERLTEFQETCTSDACSGYTETQRWIYFAGRKMFQKTGTTLKAITPNRLASEAKHFPYGETDGTPPADTKDYFATYRRDTTGLDYAWNRYYSPTMGRFTTADPYGGSEKADAPTSWNRYSYALNDPLIGTDPNGLDRIDCSLVGCLEAPPELGGGLLYVGPTVGPSPDLILADVQHVQRVQHAFQINGMNAHLANLSFADAQTYVQSLRDSGFLQPGGTITTVTVGETATTFISLYPSESGSPQVTGVPQVPGFDFSRPPNVYVTVDAPVPNPYTQFWFGASLMYFQNNQTGAWCFGLGPGVGGPANMGISVGTIVGTASGRPPEEVLSGVGVTLGGTGTLIGVPGGGHIFANRIFAPTDGAVGLAVGNEGVSYSVSITACRQP